MYRFLRTDMSQMNRDYIGGPESRADGSAMPGLAELTGLCPTVVANAAYDERRAVELLADTVRQARGEPADAEARFLSHTTGGNP